MAKVPPRLIAIDHDDYHAQFVGRTKAGQQFFLTSPFVPQNDEEPGCEFLALFLFDRAGALQTATIINLGPRAEVDADAETRQRDELLNSLGEKEFTRIEIAPFQLERFGIQFGLISRPPDDEIEDWCVTLEPGDSMCFWPPWTSGEYDT